MEENTLTMKSLNRTSEFEFLGKFRTFTILVGFLMTFCIGNSCGFTNVKSDGQSDQKIEKLFNQNKTDFETLVKMIGVDSHIIRISPTFIWKSGGKESIIYQPDSTFSHDRWEEYRQLFKKLRIKDGLIRYENPEHVFFFTGENKGISYCKCELTPTYETLDNIDPATLDSSRAVYRKIEKDWYIYYKPND